MRFIELQETLKGISSNTLTKRLKELGEANLIRREAFVEIPPRVEYKLTTNGIDLGKVIVPLMKWASKR